MAEDWETRVAKKRNEVKTGKTKGRTGVRGIVFAAGEVGVDWK